MAEITFDAHVNIACTDRTGSGALVVRVAIPRYIYPRSKQGTR